MATGRAADEYRHCGTERSEGEAIQGPHGFRLDRFVAALLAMTPLSQ
jgi:hypothetical protein